MRKIVELPRQQRRAEERASHKRARRCARIASGALTLGALFAASSASAATFTVTSLSDSGTGSLRDALAQANTNPGPDVILFDPTVTGTIALTSGALTITDSVTINGPGAAALTINGGNVSGDVYVYDYTSGTPHDVIINNLTLTGGNYSYGGAVNAIGENLTLDHVVVTGNQGNHGGGVYFKGDGVATLTVTTSTISNNIGTYGGGFNISGEASLSDVTITGNSSTWGGGGVYFYAPYGEALTVTNSKISNNTAFYAAGVAGYKGSVNLDHVTITGNTAIPPPLSFGGGGGAGVGAYYVDTLSITNSTISGNTALGKAGGGVSIYRLYTSAYLKNDTLDSNTAGMYGGGLYAVLTGPETLTILNTVVSNNVSGAAPDQHGLGGGIFIGAAPPATGPVLIADSIITGNTGDPVDRGAPGYANDLSRGGGLAMYYLHDATIRRTTISNNAATYGGGVLVAGTLSPGSGNAVFENVTIANNTADQPAAASGSGGGVLLMQSAQASFDSTTMTGNVAKTGTGGVDLTLAAVSFHDSVLANNSTSSTAAQSDLFSPSMVVANYTLVKTPVAGTILVGTGNLTGVDPQLGPLAVNGSTILAGAPGSQSPPLTELQSCISPVINAGDPTPPAFATDERGLPRISGGRIDMGAVELQTSSVQFTTAAASVNENGGSVTVTAHRTGSEGPLSVSYATADGSAQGTASGVGTPDYTPQAGTLTWNDGDTVDKTFVIPIADDNVFEGNENVIVSLSAPTCVATLGANAVETITILDNETQPSVSVGNVSQSEGNSGTSSFSFPVTLSGPSVQPVTVNFATADGSAAAGSDYAASSGTVTFAPGQTASSIGVNVTGDTLNEPNETFTVNLSGPVNATLGTGIGTGTIQNDDPLPSLSIANASVVEGNSGTSTMTFTVTLSAASGQAVTVNYATANGTATAGTDYNATSGTLTFPAGTTSQTISVPVIGDTLDEADETFTVSLSSPTNATVATPTATGTITDDDPTPAVSIGNASVAEGNSGTSNMTFTVTLSAASGQTVTVDYATANGSALAGSDYTTTGGTLTFTPGTTSLTLAVPVIGDTLDEPDETFTVSLLSPVNATIATATGTGTIVDDDAPPALTISSPSQAEGNSGTSNMIFTVTLSAASGQTVTVNYATADGTATAPADYTASSGVLTFAPGTTSQTIAVPIVGDTLNEPNETFGVTLSSPVNATIATTAGTGTIVDDDAAPVLSINNVAQAEGNSGASNMTFTVTLSSPSAQIITVNYATANGTAAAGSDYTTTNGTLTFNPGVTSQTIVVPVIGDVLSEADETFAVNLSSAVNAGIATPAGTGTIQNDDAQPSVSIGNASLAEGNSGTSNMTFTVTLSAASGQTVTVDYATANGTAVAGSDYTTTGGTLTFVPGTTSLTVNVPVIGDTVDEPDETFSVTLLSPVNATIATATGTGTIIDDDATPALAINSPAQPEGNAGTSNMVFTVTLSAASAQPVTVSFASADGTAMAGSDYTATSGILTFNPGVTSQSIAVPIKGDTSPEPNEAFTVTLSAPANAVIATAVGTGTIQNDDAVPSLSIGNASLPEGNTGTSNMTFTVTLSAASSQTVTVNFATSNGTATAGSDYTATAGTLTFAPGTTTQTLSVPILGDMTIEPDETFTVTLSAPANAALANASATGTIQNDDTPVPLSTIPTIDDWTKLLLALSFAFLGLFKLRK